MDAHRTGPYIPPRPFARGVPIVPRPKFSVRMVYLLLGVFAIVALAPLGSVAWRLIDGSRETLKTSQQEYQHLLASTISRELDAHVGGLRSQLPERRALSGLCADGRRCRGGRVGPSRARRNRRRSRSLLEVHRPARAGPPAPVRRPPAAGARAAVRQRLSRRGGEPVPENTPRRRPLRSCFPRTRPPPRS